MISEVSLNEAFPNFGPPVIRRGKQGIVNRGQATVENGEPLSVRMRELGTDCLLQKCNITTFHEESQDI